MKQVLLAYIPVLHQGYMEFLEKQQDLASELYLLNDDLSKELDYFRKDIRALSTQQMQTALQNLFPALTIKIVSAQEIAHLNTLETTIIAPWEDITQKVISEHAPDAQVLYETVFLRWNKKNVLEESQPTDETISLTDFQKKVLQLSQTEAQKSADWWRQVGAVLVKNNQILLATHNQHVPHEQQPYADGDPRMLFHKGEEIELSTAVHAEAGLIASAAKKGIRLENTELYVTTFPCPPCAKLIAYSGIKKLYFSEGYSVLDGEKILTAMGVEIIKISKS